MLSDTASSLARYRRRRISLAPDVSALLQATASAALADPTVEEQCRRMLLPLSREDAERGSDLTATLRAYYACGARVDKTAERLFLHRNSVRYRLGRVETLLRLDIDAPHVIAAIIVALAVADAV